MDKTRNIRNEKKKIKKHKGSRFLKFIVLLALIGTLVYFFLLNDEQRNKLKDLKKTNIEFKEVEGPKLNIIDEKSKSRPVAVVYDNNTNAWPHAGLSNAYAIYEFPVEGGESRVLAFFKDQKDVQVGPIRSARHYFLDYVLEHDSIFVHLGKSPQAVIDMEGLRISNINGQLYDTLRKKSNSKREFWRVFNKFRPHNAYTNMENLSNIVKERKYKTETDTRVPFKYSAQNINLDKDKSKKISSLEGAYHSGNKTVFKYDENTQKYTKTSKGIIQKDENTNKNLELKNIIILKTEVTKLVDGENKDRKNVKTTGSLEGIYSTNGRAMDIIAKKDSRTSKTKYLDKDGNEIVFNDGITFIMIVPESDISYNYTLAQETEAK